ncbi:hypothetical protein [Lentilactobacillus buchneri]|uniref:hypothetical protein n=1 Tax=Lentilactobacillus buchneri TaxID=1581 RepID=UPI0021A86496|nr:hypothetical protein [Lentilactobacillus buchneri]
MNFSKAIYISSAGVGFDNSYSGNIHLPKSFSNGQIYAESGLTIRLIKSNDSTVYFNSTDEGNNSTFIGYKNYNDAYLYIDSITAY